MNNIRPRVLRVFATVVLIAGMAASAFTFFTPRYAEAFVPDCHAKYCQIEGEDCVCCLEVEGSIVCEPCGGEDCD